MKCFEYEYFIQYGNGCGIVFAESKAEACKMIKCNPPYRHSELIDLEIKEIDVSKPQIIDHSWAE